MQPCCIILAITPANSDLANSDALQMDGIVDMESRTVETLYQKPNVSETKSSLVTWIIDKL